MSEKTTLPMEPPNRCTDITDWDGKIVRCQHNANHHPLTHEGWTEDNSDFIVWSRGSDMATPE